MTHNNSYERYLEIKAERYENRELFQMEGDVFLLQLINTKRLDGGRRTKELLKDYWDFIIWAYVVKLIDKKVYDNLCLEGYTYERDAKEVFAKVISIRDSMYNIIIGLMEGTAIEPYELNMFNAVNAEANKNLRFAITNSWPGQVWLKIEDEISLPLWRLVKSAGAFIVSDELENIRMCPCGNFFLDHSKAKNRSWCKSKCRTKHWSRENYSRRKELAQFEN